VKNSLSINWWYNINYRQDGSGYELFEKEGNKLYVIAQFYPWQFIMMLKAGKTCSFGEQENYMRFREF
jgi:hypothetical protein